MVFYRQEKNVATNKNKYPEWKYSDLVASFGRGEDVSRMIDLAGYKPPPLKTIYGWRTRNSIPGRWVPLLIMLAQEQGLIKDIRTLLVK
jgi:hypothetical protein